MHICMCMCVCEKFYIYGLSNYVHMYNLHTYIAMYVLTYVMHTYLNVIKSTIEESMEESVLLQYGMSKITCQVCISGYFSKFMIMIEMAVKCFNIS